MGLATVRNVVKVQNVADFVQLFGRDLKGLGVQKKDIHQDYVQTLCESCNLDRKFIENGRLLL